MARQAVKLLIEQVRSKRAGNQLQMVHELMDYTLVERESSAATSMKKRSKG
jgi:DNA-binding LacI/PurR family transcriptional regulator